MTDKFSKRWSREALWRYSNRLLKDKYQDEMYCICSPVVNIIDKVISPAYLKFVQTSQFEKSSEALARFYPASGQPAKIEELTTFYKFHQEVPRLFMKDKCLIIHQYYDSKRRINYERIRRMLELESCEGSGGRRGRLLTYKRKGSSFSVEKQET